MRRFPIHATCLAAALLVVVACGGGGGNGPTGGTTSNYPGTTPDPTNTTPNSVNATASSTFDPASLTVPKGTTVTFTFLSVTHNVTFDAASGAPANIPSMSGGSITRTFSASGTFGYQCTLHNGMRGTVIVQ